MINQDSNQSPVVLGSCLVIEARHSSRCEIVGALNASRAFASVLHAATVSETIVLLQNKNFDVCLIGPKTSLPRIVPGLAQAIQSSESKNCVLIAFSQDELQDPEDQTLLSKHNVILRPYSKQSLSDAVIREVVKSRGSDTWVGVNFKTPPALALPALPPSSFEPKAQAAAGPVPFSAPVTISSGKNRLIVDIFSTLGNRLKAIAQDGSRGMYMLTPAGAPTQITKTALDKVVFAVVCEIERHEPVSEDFHCFLCTVLYQWFSDYVLEGPKAAATNLRISLTDYMAADLPN